MERDLMAAPSAGDVVLSGLSWWEVALLLALLAIVLVLLVYAMRHYVFTLNRVFGRQRHPYVDVTVADWPTVAVLIPAHNEEAVIEDAVEALLASDYPSNRLEVIPIDDRSSDATADRIIDVAVRHPRRVHPLYRVEGKGGKGAALREAMERTKAEVIMVFDADYTPGRGLVRQLAAPFFDPEVGAVMGRVIPLNVDANLLTRLQELERSGGYQVDQQARMNLGLVPQYGGTVGGLRRRALEEIGGWPEDTLTEDTDATFRLLLHGWTTVYQNRSECYEEVAEQWPVRQRQVARWASGHNQAMRRHLMSLMRHRDLSVFQRIDGALLLSVYTIPALILGGWVLGLIVFLLGLAPLQGIGALLAVASYATVGNFAAFFEVAVAARLDRNPARIRLLPFLLGGFVATVFAVARAVVPSSGNGGQLLWHKTTRYRAPRNGAG